MGHYGTGGKLWFQGEVETCMASGMLTGTFLIGFD